MASDTDYDSLPSPPKKLRTANERRTGANTRRYGKRATKATPVTAAKASQPDATGSTNASAKRQLHSDSSQDSDDSEDDGEVSSPSPKRKTDRSKRAKAAPANRRKESSKGKERAVEEADADVESEADNDEDLPTKKRASAEVQSTTTASRASDEVTKPTKQPSRRTKAAKVQVDTNNPTEHHPSGGRSETPEALSTARSQPLAKPTRRKSTALADKSNSAQSTRGPPERGKAAKVPIEAAKAKTTMTALPTPAKPAGGSSKTRSTLQVYHDAPLTSVSAAPDRRPSLPLTDLPPRRPRPPHRSLARHASEPPTSLSDPGRIASSTTTLPRSPTQLPFAGGSARLSRAQQFLFPPSQASEAQHLARPAPWALSAPASPVGHHHHSSSPIGGAGEGLPIFQFTTTEFGDLPSLQLEPKGGELRARESGLLPRIEGDAVGEGMDSTIMLETWDDSASAQPVPDTASMSCTAEHDLGDSSPGETTIKASQNTHATAADTAASRAEEEVDGGEGDSTVRVDPSTTAEQQSLTGGNTHGPAEESMRTADTSIPRVAEQNEQEQRSGNGSRLEDEVDDPLEELTQPANIDESAPKPNRLALVEGVDNPQDKPRRKSCGPVHYTSTFLPPRHPRWPVDEPLPDGPPSSEDELAYYLRTTGTFSSEDDLPASDEAPSDESAKEDWLAERGVGRAVKASSRQREKRIVAFEEARLAARLQLGEGAGGRRKEWKREILPLDQVRLPRQMREAIEAKAAELGEELEGIKAEGERTSGGDAAMSG
ncbi:hypothetical protein JCM10908_006879 [Rhodotorula pacifica]|uniref:uncharacterized protein n=1 Tax=Rhodotorula pacifica TaxID=1495444 RepID=UPI0031770C84